jgi:ABC-type glycerol-3-phosphate transport system substrate-binding protein
MINNRLYGVNLSLNANVIIYNHTLANELGITMPQGDYTWDELIEILALVHERSGGTVYGVPDIRMLVPLDLFIPVWNMTYRDCAPPFPWTETEMLVTADDVAAFMEFWSNVPYGVLLPPDETATGCLQVNAAVGRRRTMLELNFSGTFAMIQSQTQDELRMIQYPNNRRGQGEAVSARPGLVQAVFSRSRNPDLAIRFLEWLATDPEAGLLLGTTRGVLPSTTQVEALLASGNLSRDDQQIFDVTNKVFEGRVNPFSSGLPDTGPIWDNMIAVGQSVAFGAITPEEAGRQFEQLVAQTIGR